MAGDVILGYGDTPSARFDERLVVLFAYAPQDARRAKSSRNTARCSKSSAGRQ